MSNAFWSGNQAAVRRVVYKGAGWSHSDITEKPHIGIANTYAENSPAHINMRRLAEAVKEGVWEAGGMPVEFGVPSTCGNVSISTPGMRYELAGRDAVAMAIEFVAEVTHFDGMVMLSCCDNIIPGTILAGLRTNIPSIVLTGGPMETGCYHGKELITPDINVATYKSENDIPKDFLAMEDACCPGVGSCAVMGTAMTMQILAEVLGYSLPGSSCVPAATAERIRIARETGRRAVELAKQHITPRQLITRDAIDNAAIVDLGIGGSSNAVLHLLAIAYEAGIPYSLDDFDHHSNVPCICGVRSAGPFSVMDLWRAGGVPAVEKVLLPYMHQDVINVGGSSLKQVADEAHPVFGGVLRPLDNPWHHVSGLAVLHGNLAEEGAVVRTTGIVENMREFRGPARVFDKEGPCAKAILDGKIHPGDVIVIRYEGVKGSPGMNELMDATDALTARGLDDKVGLITDGRFSGFNKGPIVGHIEPEAMRGGNLALVEEGDIIHVDCIHNLIELEVSDEVLAERRKKWHAPSPKICRGMMANYARCARPASEGGAMQSWPIDAENHL